MACSFSLTIVNHAASANRLIVYQSRPETFAPDAASLVWLSQYSYPDPNAEVVFTWDDGWGFGWVNPKPTHADGTSSDFVPASPENNQITLAYSQAYHFIDQGPGGQPTRLYLKQDGTIPVGSPAMVGVGQECALVYGVQAQPNQTRSFDPSRNYCLAYGQYEPGQVLDLAAVGNPLQLPFSDQIRDLKTTLQADNTWTPPLPNPPSP